MAKQLVQVQMERRMVNSHIPREIRSMISRILGVPEKEEEKSDTLILEKRKICCLCPSKNRRMTKYLCLRCHKPVCLQCTKPICNKCTEEKQ